MQGDDFPSSLIDEARMVIVTPQAMDVLRDLIAAEDLAPQGGVHIRIPTTRVDDGDASAGVESGVDIEVVGAAPAKTEQLLAGQDCRLFLDKDAATYLNDKVLDATHDATGKMRFTVSQQSG